MKKNILKLLENIYHQYLFAKAKLNDTIYCQTINFINSLIRRKIIPKI